ncbi:hypothetical protein CIL05_12140 [Virgibacillus profundi]|uniref:PepSY domain-containing protein n=1 Tax=Virgibacillus profundi TaxID=2024555 RepID=A0A2A2IDD3_9BACI|nr:hypothetical protein [Virgibacillus profundi]PAV29145.1 hypothetical protein CIL05_12140 [Virgibacillus profundi]PXY53314.1 hypothetical protein CIT14_12265 [Virgibacillus profundi]
MLRNLSFFIGTGLLVISCLIGCSNEPEKTESDVTFSDKNAEEKGVLSKDDAEVLVYNELSAEEKQNLTIDFIKEEGTKYFIRVYETVNGEMKVKKKYTVDFYTEEIKLID